MKQIFCPDTASRPRAGRPKAAPSQSLRVTRAARPRINRNGSGATPPARPSSASRSTIGVANVTRRPVFGSVHRIVPRSTATLRTSGRAARTASAMTRSPSIRPTVAAAIASALTMTVVCLGGRRRRAGRDGLVGPNSVPGHPSRGSCRDSGDLARHRQGEKRPGADGAGARPARPASVGSDLAPHWTLECRTKVQKRRTFRRELDRITGFQWLRAFAFESAIASRAHRYGCVRSRNSCLVVLIRVRS
jgi:hypothetical protein